MEQMFRFPAYNVSTFEQFLKIPASQLSPSRGRPLDPQRGDYWTEDDSGTIYVCVDDNGTVHRHG